MTEPTMIVVILGLAALVAMVLLGVVGLLVFWSVATKRGSHGPQPRRRVWWTVITGVATITSAVVAVATFFRV